MKSVIIYKIQTIKEETGYDHNTCKHCIQKTAECYVDTSAGSGQYGILSGGSAMQLKTINPEVYKYWFIGAQLTCVIEVGTTEGV